MRNLFYSLLLLTIFNGFARAQEGSSCITLNISDTSEQNFLDTVESKLLETITKQNVQIDVYYNNPNDGTDWSERLTKNEIKNMRIPRKYVPTYKYQFVINWNPTLDTGYVLGFSKEYYYDFWIYDYKYKKGASAGVFCWPFYHIPLAEYKTFLNQEELTRLYKLIKKNFINYIDYDTVGWRCNDTTCYASFFIPDTSSLSYRTIDLAKDNEIVLMPLAYWVSIFKYRLFSGELSCYKDVWCTKQNKSLSKYNTNNIFNTQEEDVIDEKGDKDTTVINSCPISSITVAEKWNFNTVNIDTPYFWPYAIIITREIKSIAINTTCDNGYTIENKRTWLHYKDIVSLSNKEGFHFYEEQLDNALFKKLNLQYPKLY